MQSGPVKRVSIWVRDTEKSLRVYRDALGLSVIEDKIVSGPNIGRLVGLEDATLRIVHVSYPQTTHGWIGFYEVRDAKPRSLAELPKPDGFPRYGQTTIVIATDNMAQIVPRLRAQGVVFLTEPTEYIKTTPGDATPPGRYSEAIFWDPDHVPVSLIGFAPP